MDEDASRELERQDERKLERMHALRAERDDLKEQLSQALPDLAASRERTQALESELKAEKSQATRQLALAVASLYVIAGGVVILVLRALGLV